MMKLQDLRTHSPKAFDHFNATGLPQTFSAKATQTGVEMTIYDVIGTDETNAKTFADALAAADGKPVTIHLSSPGGSVYEGWAMYNSLRDYAGPTTVMVDGVCASIASCFALGADTVISQETSLWMIHNSWLLTAGNASELRDTATILDKVDQNLMAVYAKKAGGDAAVWAPLMAKETWFTSAEILAVGLVDQIAPEPITADAKAILRASIETVIAKLEADNAEADRLSEIARQHAIAARDSRIRRAALAARL